jgi:hypothetical protein
MKSYQEMMIEKYADELVEALSTDLKKACKILTKIFKGVTMGELQDLYEQLNESGNNYSLINVCFCGCSHTLLKGARAGAPDAYIKISNIMEDLRYDNGLPLSGVNYPKDNPTQWNDFFDHYDRDQDFWGFYWDYPVYNFTPDGTSIYVRVDCSLSELRGYLTEAYEGASWNHDFNRRW